MISSFISSYTYPHTHLIISHYEVYHFSEKIMAKELYVVLVFIFQFSSILISRVTRQPNEKYENETAHREVLLLLLV